MQEFLNLIQQAFEQNQVCVNIKDRLKAETEKLERLKYEIKKKMEAVDLKKQDVPGFGSVQYVTSRGIKTPKAPEEKQALFSWIREHKGEDVLENMVSVNHNTLNAFYKEELEQAIMRGEVGFKLPGCEVGADSTYIKLKSEKK